MALFNTQLTRQATQLVQQLARHGQAISTAESCTGGLLSGLITSIPGASEVFHQGFITYSNYAKTRALQVDAALIQTHGAVSAQVAEAMASGAINAAQADVALSITGIAGPGGGSAEKPVGLVYIGFATKKMVTHTSCNFTGDRDEIRLTACARAIELALQHLSA